MKRRLEFMEMLAKNAFVKSHLYGSTWISGENTTVYPIQEWRDGVEVQWKSDRPCQKWIDKIVAKNSDIIKLGCFTKSDGSCPSYISFKYL